MGIILNTLHQKLKRQRDQTKNSFKVKNLLEKVNQKMKSQRNKNQ